jgi:hypothetical protein
VNRIKLKKQKGPEKRGGVDILFCMFVTFAVSHLERSELNADASQNAVLEYVHAVVWTEFKKKNEQRSREKKKKHNVVNVRKNRIGWKNNNQRKKEWTYFDTWWSPQQYSTWKCPR